MERWRTLLEGVLDRGLLVQDGPAYRLTGTVEALEVPETLHALIAARLDGLSPDLISKLADGGIHTRDDLADLAVDELTDMTGVDDTKAKELIMKAREHWFTA